MRVALVTPGYAPVVGGVETAVTALARALVGCGAEVEVWTADRDRPGVEQRDGVLVRRVRAYGPQRYPLAPGLWAHTARQAARPDVVHAHGFHTTAALGVLAGGAPYVLSPHYHGVGHTPAARLLHRAYRPVGRRLLDRAAAVVAVSAAEQALLLRDAPGLAGRTTVVHHGVDTARLRAAEPFPGQPPTVLVLGRLEPYKRVDEVLRAFDDSTAPGQLVVVGDGPDRPRLQALADGLRRREDVRLLGRLSDVDVASWLRTASVLVSLSEHEAFGLVALEAAAAGAAVLLSDVPAHREVAGLAPGRVSLVRPGGLRLDAALRAPRPGPVELRSWDDCALEHLAVYARVRSGQPTTTSS